MAIGTPVDQGHAASIATPASLTITTLANITAHSAIFLWHYSNSASLSVMSDVQDSAGNKWFTAGLNNTTAPLAELWYCPDSAVLNSGGTITPTWTTGALRHAITAFSVTGLLIGTQFTTANLPNPLDMNDVPASITATNTGATITMTPYGSNIQLLTAAMGTASNPGTFTPGGSWTAIGGSAATAWILPMYQIVASTADVAASPSWVNSVSNRLSARSFKGLPATNTAQAMAMMTGVGA